MFLDESGFLLIPTVTRTWAPRGQTPFFYHLYKQDRISAFSALAVSPQRQHIALYLRFRQRNLNGLDVRAFLKHLLHHVRGPIVLLWDQGTIHRRREVKAFLAPIPGCRSKPSPGTPLSSTRQSMCGPKAIMPWPIARR